MAINRFYQPAQGQYVSQFVPTELPAELMISTLGRKQAVQDAGVKNMQLLGDWKMDALAEHDTNYVKEKQKKFRDFFEQNQSKEWASPEIQKQYHQLVRSINDDTGLKQVKASWDKHQQFLETWEALKKKGSYQAADELKHRYEQSYREYTAVGGKGFTGNPLDDPLITEGVDKQAQLEEFFNQVGADSQTLSQWIQGQLGGGYYAETKGGKHPAKLLAINDELRSSILDSSVGKQLKAQYDMYKFQDSHPDRAIAKMSKEEQEAYLKERDEYVMTESAKVALSFRTNDYKETKGETLNALAKEGRENQKLAERPMPTSGTVESNETIETAQDNYNGRQTEINRISQEATRLLELNKQWAEASAKGETRANFEARLDGNDKAILARPKSYWQANQRTYHALTAEQRDYEQRSMNATGQAIVKTSGGHVDMGDWNNYTENFLPNVDKVDSDERKIFKLYLNSQGYNIDDKGVVTKGDYYKKSIRWNDPITGELKEATKEDLPAAIEQIALRELKLSPEKAKDYNRMVRILDKTLGTKDNLDFTTALAGATAARLAGAQYLPLAGPIGGYLIGATIYDYATGDVSVGDSPEWQELQTERKAAFESGHTQNLAMKPLSTVYSNNGIPLKDQGTHVYDIQDMKTNPNAYVWMVNGQKINPTSLGIDVSTLNMAGEDYSTTPDGDRKFLVTITKDIPIPGKVDSKGYQVFEKKTVQATVYGGKERLRHKIADDANFLRHGQDQAWDDNGTLTPEGQTAYEDILYKTVPEFAKSTAKALRLKGGETVLIQDPDNPKSMIAIERVYGGNSGYSYRVGTVPTNSSRSITPGIIFTKGKAPQAIKYDGLYLKDDEELLNAIGTTYGIDLNQLGNGTR